MKIKFKANRFQPKNWLGIYLWYVPKFYYAKARGKRLKITVLFDWNMLYDAVDAREQFDWLKLFGSKSGVRTNTNKELINAYRTFPLFGEVDFCDYHRLNERHWQEPEITYWAEGGRLKHTNIIEPKYALPVTVWAGGTYPPTTSHSYEVFIDVVD